MSDPIELEDNFILIVSDQGVAIPEAHASSHAAAGDDPLTLTLSQISNAGTIASQNANNVALTGGTIAGVTFSSSAATITGGTISGAVITASSATLTGGTINGMVIGGSTPAAGSFTSGSFTGNVTIGGTLAVTGAVTLAVPLALGQGGTGATTQAGARSAIGLGTIATQSAASVALTGGTINGIVIGGVSPAVGTFTSLGATNLAVTGTIVFTTALSVANGGSGAATLTGVLVGNGTSAFTASTSSTTGQVLRCTGANTFAFGALNLADTNAVTGVLPIANGGTGSSTAAAALTAFGITFAKVTLTAGVATIADTSVTADTIVVASHLASASPAGHLYVDITAGVGFDIKSTNVGDVNDVNYIRVN